jgi:hypothetical protein
MGLEPTIFAMQLKPESNALPLGQGLKYVSLCSVRLDSVQLTP